MQEISALFTKPSFVFDMICAAALLLIALYQGRRGFVATLVGLIGNLAGLVGAKLAADWASPQIFDRLMAPRFLASIEQTLAENGTLDLSQLTDQLAGFLPESLRQTVLGAFGQSVVSVPGVDAAALARSIVADVVQPLMTPVLSIVVFFVVFAVCRMVVGMLVHLLTAINSIPIIGSVNHTLGIAMGLVYAAVSVFFALCVVWALIVITGGSLPWLNDTALAESLFYQLFGRLNPFVV